MRRRAKSFIYLAAGAMAASVAIVAGPAAADLADPAAVTGALVAQAQGAVTGLAVYAEPNPEVEDAAALGSTLPYFKLPSSAVSFDGADYTVSVAPTGLPAASIDPTGLVTFEVVALSGDTPLGSTVTSVRAVYDSAGVPQWLDPNTSVDGMVTYVGGVVPIDAPHSSISTDQLLGPVTADLASVAGIEVPASPLTDDETEIPAPEDLASVDDANQQELSATAAATSSCVPGQGAGDVKVASKSAWETIGTGYPVSGDTSTMTSSATSGVDFTTTVGIGSDSVGYWQQSGTKSVSRTTGFDWTSENYSRAYQISQEMVKIAHYYDRCPPSAPYYRSWEAVKISGSYGENSGINRPDFTTCRQFTSTGNWWRSDSSGKAYTLSYGLKMYKTIGIDLSSKHNYNQEGQLGYHITSGRWLCGNNDVPAYAGKVMERLNNA